MTVDELDRLQRDVEDAARRLGSAGCSEAAAFEESVVLFRRLVGLARKDLERGRELEPRLSFGLRALATMVR